MTKLPSDSAVLVIDMQNSFLHPEGKSYGGGFFPGSSQPLINISETIESNRQLIEHARASSVPVICTRHCYRAGYTDAPARSRAVYLSRLPGALLSGSWDAAIFNGIGADEDTIVIDKTRMDSFYNTDLEVVLHGLGVRQLIVGGIIMNACVETTTRAAAIRDLPVTVVSDCCTAYTEADQANSLAGLQGYALARVQTLDEAKVA
jgi:nicotinamidase-related amidase